MDTHSQSRRLPRSARPGDALVPAAIAQQIALSTHRRTKSGVRSPTGFGKPRHGPHHRLTECRSTWSESAAVSDVAERSRIAAVMLLARTLSPRLLGGSPYSLRVLARARRRLIRPSERGASGQGDLLHWHTCAGSDGEGSSCAGPTAALLPRGCGAGIEPSCAPNEGLTLITARSAQRRGRAGRGGRASALAHRAHRGGGVAGRFVGPRSRSTRASRSRGQTPASLGGLLVVARGKEIRESHRHGDARVQDAYGLLCSAVHGRWRRIAFCEGVIERELTPLPNQRSSRTARC